MSEHRFYFQLVSCIASTVDLFITLPTCFYINISILYLLLSFFFIYYLTFI